MNRSPMFNPFGSKSAHEVTPADLELLLDVAEGWFVEYKRAPCKPRDYAKPVSAFANDRGGWLFIGVEQDPVSRKPAAAPGVAWGAW